MCTRVFNNLNVQYTSTSRNFNWPTPLPTTLFAFARGLHKRGTAVLGARTLEWCSRYSSVVTMIGREKSADGAPDPVGYGVTDGVNEMGLLINAQWEGNAQLPHGVDKPHEIDLVRLCQYLLDSFDSVSAAVAFLEQDTLQINPSVVPGSDINAKPHLSLSDRSGNSAIVEFTDGVTRCYMSGDYRVMTNEPGFKEQLKLMAEWEFQEQHAPAQDKKPISGGMGSIDHFERATFYLARLRPPVDMHESLAQAKSVASVCGLPLGNVKPDGKEVSQTQWQTIGDQNRPIYYFANARTPAVAWLDLAELITSHLQDNKTAWMLKMVMSDPAVQGAWLNPAYSGDVAGELKNSSDPFAYTD
jgi:penicillin V acylase-like amidase (Ntn superfamily)